MVLNKRVLVGTIGYQLLGNHSVGPNLLPEIKQMGWPEGVTVEEMNWGPIAIVQYFEALEKSFDRVVFLVAIERPNRMVGEIEVFKWMGGLPSEKQIQACIGDAATGVISVENLLVIGEFFKIWPSKVFLVDVEPGPEKAGEFLTQDVQNKVPEILRILEEVSINEDKAIDNIELLNGNSLFN